MKILTKKNHQGQAAIEFMVVILVIFFFLLFFLSFSLLMVVSEYMEYATFMAARTYKAGAGSREGQERVAREVFDQYAQFVTGNGLARNVRLIFANAEGDNEQTAGVIANYDIDMFYLPPIFAPNNNIPSRITLSSEAFLGREVGVTECLSFFGELVQRLNIPNMERFAEDMDDNGC